MEKGEGKWNRAGRNTQKETPPEEISTPSHNGKLAPPTKQLLFASSPTRESFGIGETAFERRSSHAHAAFALSSHRHLKFGMEERGLVQKGSFKLVNDLENQFCRDFTEPPETVAKQRDIDHV